MEERLRLELKQHEAFLDSLMASPDESCQAFVDGIVKSLVTATTAKPSPCKPFIKLVSIDVDRDALYQLLQKDEEMMKIIANLSSSSSSTTTTTTTNGDVFYQTQPGYIKNTHVTVVHGSNAKQEELHRLYDSKLGTRIRVEITGLLWKPNVVAALAVVITTHGLVPTTTNEFVHITLWCANGISPFDSNKLIQWEDTKEYKVKKDPFVLDGVLTFWDKNKTSKS